MINKALILFLFLFSCTGFAQTNSVIGKWKVVAVDNGEVFYNAKTDSISILSEDMKEMYTDESKIKTLKELIKKLYTNNRFEFDAKNIKWEVYGSVIESKYKTDSKKGVIVMESENSLDEIVADEIPYQFKDGQLHLTMNFTEPPASFILEKIN